MSTLRRRSGSGTVSPTSTPRRQSGQAAVELIALLPLLAVLTAALWQVVLLGHAHWATAGAARVAARAAALGDDPGRAARTQLPRSLARALRVRRSGDRVELSVRVPPVPGLPSLGHVTARASFEDQR